MSKKGILLLENGMTFEGESVGAEATRVGELCFNTGMTGYQELFTDPSYYGQMLVMTTNHIGNYGTIPIDNEANHTSIFGLICREFSDKKSREQANHTLGEFLIQNEVPAIKGIDTRYLVRTIRKDGSMKAVLSTDGKSLEELKTILAQAPSMKGLELASKVTTPQPYEVGDSQNQRFRVAVMDYGIKKSILDNLVNRNCLLKVFPAQTPYQEVLAWNPDGIFLSNGPGDPASMDYAIEQTKQFLNQNIPTFGICMGHQILALALNATTYKLHNGHRGLNHPVKNLIKGTSEITSQNHGFGVDQASIQNNSQIEVTHINLNDDTIEGIRVKGKPAFSVQYHPESSPGPHDSSYLFDEFIELMQIKK